MTLAKNIAIAFLVTFISAFIFRWIAIKLHIIDAPGRRKVHDKDIPLLGGFAVYLGIVVGLILNGGSLQYFAPIMVGATIVLVVGLIDDKRGLSAQTRLLAQIAAAAVLIGSGMRLSFLPNNEWGNLGEIFLTIIWVVGLTNAFNYLDGLDGLATGLAAICAFFFSVIAYSTGQSAIGLAGLLLMAGCIGFLPHNFKNAKMFLGDAGSTFIGFTLAAFALVGAWAEDNVIKLAIPIIILGVPIFDMVFTTVMRIKEKKISNVIEWLKYTGRDHFHHRLMDLGLTQTGTVFFIYFVNILLGISAIMASNEEAVVGVLAVIQAAIIFVGAAVLMIVGKRQRD